LHDRANRQNGVDFDPNNANALLMFAWLFPDVLAARLTASIEAACNTPYPVEARAERLLALSAELETLQRVECALIDAAGGDADPRMPPAMTLGVRVNGQV
jgi:hypothetical protein